MTAIDRLLREFQADGEEPVERVLLFAGGFVAILSGKEFPGRQEHTIWEESGVSREGL
jgi:hypothetical protein